LLCTFSRSAAACFFAVCAAPAGALGCVCACAAWFATAVLSASSAESALKT
jgi:hypothetical protein